MTNYDFTVLSPFEFEILSRDLLQKHLDTYMESFGEGADLGIDLRCSQGDHLIVQAKRYKSFNQLFPNLQKELPKVNKLKPKRYIITTSVSLSPIQKNRIFELFKPFIKAEDDIFGKEDLNNLINKFPSVEKDFHKLWMASTNILNRILHSQIINHTNFAIEEIKSKIKVYVQNESFNEALSILKENKYVVISGPPGIGKTTLAEMLVFEALSSKDNTEFVFISDRIEDGYKLFDENKIQIFLFDDFLGRNFLQNSIATNEEKNIIRFITKIQNSKNKALVFTTREYILNQAKLKFDLLDDNLSKCILDVSKYNKIDRAKILYNHFFINEIPYEYVYEIIRKDYLFKIIDHRSYNPRIIATLSSSKFWSNYQPADFPSALLKLFDSPFLIWKHVFENQISDQSRIILECLLITGADVDYNELYKQAKLYLEANKKEFNFTLNSYNYKNSLRELENSMIKIKRHFSEITIAFQNPSIQDFLVSYISEDKIAKNQLLNSVHYLKPAIEIFSIYKIDERKIFLDSDDDKLFQNILIEKFSDLEFNPKNKKFSYPTGDDLIVIKLNLIKDFFHSSLEPIEGFIKTKFMEVCYSEELSNKSLHEYTSLLVLISQDINIDIDLEEILNNISGNFWDLEDLYCLTTIENHFPEKYEIVKDNNEDLINDFYYDIVSGLMLSDSDDLEELNGKLEDLRTLENDFNYDTFDERSEIESKIEEIERSRQYDDFEDYPYPFPSRHGSIPKPSVKGFSNYSNSSPDNISNNSSRQEPSENEIINNIFKSLK